jgi:hypothetical protein
MRQKLLSEQTLGLSTTFGVPSHCERSLFISSEQMIPVTELRKQCRSAVAKTYGT